LALDYWKSHLDFEAFRAKYQVERERFAQLVAFEGLLEKEVLFGAYYESDSGDENDIVPA